MLIQLVCLLFYFISRDATLESCLIQMQIKFLREWLSALEGQFSREDPWSWASRIILKLKQVKGLSRIATHCDEN